MGGPSIVTAADVDGDGLPEVLFTTQLVGVHVIRADGTYLPGWPFVGFDLMGTPLVGDIDGDGQAEVVVLSSVINEIYAIGANGELKSGWPVTVPLLDLSSKFKFCLGDLDGDGALEVLVAARNETVHALDGNGQPVPGWPVQFDLSPWLPPGIRQINEGWLAVGDVDFDGVSEVVVPFDLWVDGSPVASPVFLLNGDGTLRPGWPIVPPGGGFTRLPLPAIIDLDGDGECEIVGSGGGRLYVLNADGSTQVFFTLQYSLVRPIAAADLDGDGRMEIINSGVALQIYDLEQGLIAQTDPDLFRHYQAVTVGDFNGDGTAEIVSLSDSAHGTLVNAVHVFDSHLQEFPGFPIIFDEQAVWGTIFGSALADLDGDNDLEIIHRHGTSVYAWDLPNPGGGPVSVQWQMLGHDSRVAYYPHTFDPHFLRGDGNRDGRIDVDDAIVALTWLYTGETNPCPAQLDVNADETLDLADPIHLLGHIFNGGPPPAPPFPRCDRAPESVPLPLPCAETDCTP